MHELPKGYEPAQVEGRIYDMWMKGGYFQADDTSTKPVFSMVIPPPNVTGALHMGHALNYTIPDIIVRYKRMLGHNTLWLPGLDHAGIATQMVVERLISKEEGIKKETLGREKFLERVWQWKEKYGGVILNQQKRIGISVDWDRLKFTLDPGLSKAVRKVFVDLYKDGLIYRGNRLVNWCPRCQTAVSDLEVKHVDTKGSLWHIRYPFSDGSGEVVVATTRPETMLGDTAVAVHPDDDRYKKFHGKKIKLPLTDREIPLLTDSVVALDFGTGAVKITPAHDFNDYETGKRHNLSMISIFDTKGVLNDAGGNYKGLKNPEARKKVLEDLSSQGFLVKEEPHPMSVGKCDRCENTIEPMLSDQWFVKIKPLADKAAQAARDKKIQFHPENWEKIYLDWLERIQDWCISRQLWWGHQIPAWTCAKNHVTVSETTPTACESCGDKTLTQDPDVLDTWFSSGLWPFSTMGWPEKTVALEKYYPTSLLVTGMDIIFFWVCRMAMMGLHFMKDVPFRHVHIHGLVRDERGQKMSKTKGNVVDPLELMNDYGADALRFTLASLVTGGGDIRFSEERLDGYRNFINKIWNATRFAMAALQNVKLESKVEATKLTLADKYIVEKWKQTLKKVRAAIEDYRINDAAQELYHFTWGEFCDWYLELSKPVLYGTDDAQKSVSGSVLMQVHESLVRALHPFIPFVTEEIYQHLPQHKDTICTQSYPSPEDALFKLGTEAAAHEIEVLKSVITALRNIRGENRIKPGDKIKARIASDNKKVLGILEANRAHILNLARVSDLEMGDKEGSLQKSAVSLVAGSDYRVTVVVPLEGLVDFQEEIKRLNKELEKVDKDLGIVNTRLSQETFVKNAPPAVVTQEKDRQKMLQDQLKQIKSSLERLS